MAKRLRGSSTRPGQRARLQRRAPTSRPSDQPTAPAPTSLTEAEEARAAELEAEIVASERTAEATVARTRERSRRPTHAESAGPRSGSIALRASQEYAYVSRDVRRIVVIGGSLIGLLLGIWVVVEATGVGPF
jgi:hypothetical protein